MQLLFKIIEIYGLDEILPSYEIQTLLVSISTTSIMIFHMWLNYVTLGHKCVINNFKYGI
jgi:hypothetical protein